jgi:peptidoglycan/LPS O-acetylase OafA/YrhL
MGKLISTHSIAYRPDIDGLRAFAVLSVLVFHAFPDLLPGGFVGVDVFFVISGYLISGIMFRELSEGRFNFSSFYARRVKRIFPALILVLAVSFAVGWSLLFDDELKQLGDHLMRAAAFLSNFALLKESGYFDNAAETKPLLHLWSLAIEEQFYLLWPVVVWGLWRIRSRRGLLMLLLWAASLSWNLIEARHHPARDFYSPLTRFWELLSGALLAYWTHTRGADRLPAWTGTDASRGILGMLALLASLALIDPSRAFPGAWALLPVLGATLTISASGHSWWNHRILSHRWTVWIGVISYPLYLWHWPILSYLRIVEGGTPAAGLRAAGMAASVALAIATYAWIEKPLRFGPPLRYRTAGLSLMLITIGIVGYFVQKAEGVPSRSVMAPEHVNYPGDIGHDGFHAHYGANLKPCADEEIQKNTGSWKGTVRCFQSKSDQKIDMLLLGDSHAEHLMLGLAEQLPHHNIAFYGRGALPTLGSPEYRMIFDHVLRDPRIKVVLVTARWETRLKEKADQAMAEKELTSTLRALLASGKQVYLIDDTPSFPFDPQRCKLRRPLSQSTQCDMPAADYRKRQDGYLQVLTAAKKSLPEVGWISLDTLLCDNSKCSMAPRDEVLLRDSHHLNIPGSREAATLILRQAPELAKP